MIEDKAAVDFLAKEYEMLVTVYVHENEMVNRYSTVMVTVQGGLIALSATSENLLGRNLLTRIGVAVFGIVLATTWVVVYSRTVAYRDAYALRIRDIEDGLQAHWPLGIESPGIRRGLAGRVAASSRIPLGPLGRMSATTAALILPCLVVVYWLGYPFASILG